MSVEIIRGNAELDKMSKELVAHIKDTDERIASYLLSECIHIEEHRNPTRLNQFFTAIKGSGQRVNAMHNFVQVFANLKFQKEAANSIVMKDGKPAVKVVKGIKDPYAKEGQNGEVWGVYYLIKNARKQVVIKVTKDGKTEKQTLSLDQHWERAQNTPWYKFQPEKAPTAFDADAKIKSLLKQLWGVVLDGDAIVSDALMNGLTNLAFATGVAENPSDLLPTSWHNKTKDVPEKYKGVLHLVVDNTQKKPDADEAGKPTADEQKEIAKTLANPKPKNKANPGASLG
jgi:hypothetical protein